MFADMTTCRLILVELLTARRINHRADGLTGALGCSPTITPQLNVIPNDRTAT